MPPHAFERQPRFVNGFFLDQRIADLFGQEQNIADTLLPLGNRDPLLPLVVFTPEPGRKRSLQRFAVRFHESIEQVEDRAVDRVHV